MQESDSMSDYPIWWSDTITVYNKYVDPLTDVITWYRTVISGAFWKYVGDKINIGAVTLETDNTICRIRENAKFVPYYQWISIPKDEKPNYFSLTVGDIIVKGDIQDDIDEYTSGHRSTDFIEKYKQRGCIVIQEVAINIGPGKEPAHYRVKGV